MHEVYDPHWMLHVAALISVGALTLRDQLKLRSVLTFSIGLNALYNLMVLPGPDWQDLFWNLVSLAINLTVLTQLVLDRTHVGLSAEEEKLFEAFEMLTPGEFRALVKLATWRTAETAVEITREGETPHNLYYVLRGGIALEKAGRTVRIEPGTFIGEIAFLHRGAASATVRLEPGTRYLEWPVGSLARRIEGRQALKDAVVRLISFDMALKLARS